MNRIFKEHMMLHLEEMMEDMDAYGWDKVHVFHAARMNQLEQSRFVSYEMPSTSSR